MGSKHLTKFRAACLLVLCLALAGKLFLVDGFLYDQKRNGEIINVAGRQRMLSQRIAKGVAMDLPGVEADISEWQARHVWLKDDLDGKPAQQYLHVLDTLVYALGRTARNPTGGRGRMEEVNDLAEKFVVGMDDIVDDLSVAATTRVNRLQTLDHWLTRLTLGILLLELLVVFRQFSRR